MVNTNTYLFLQGVGQLIALELLFVTGGESKPKPDEATDATAQHLIRFDPQNPHTTKKKKLVIRNSTYVATANRIMLCSLNRQQNNALQSKNCGQDLICDTILS